MRSKRKVTVVSERDEERYYVASFPGLRGCHRMSRILDTLMKCVREVIEVYIDAGEEVDHCVEFVGIQQISV